MLPTLDEEGALEDIHSRIPIEDLKQRGYTTRVVIVDGGSKDKTLEIAVGLGCEVIHQWGEGKGAGTVSYTHIRAHETSENLVLRLMV